MQSWTTTTRDGVIVIVLERSYLLLLHSSRNINIDNDSFQVESTFKDLGDTIDQCGGCSDAVSTYIVSSWKAFQELLSILTNCNPSKT